MLSDGCLEISSQNCLPNWSYRGSGSIDSPLPAGLLALASITYKISLFLLLKNWRLFPLTTQYFINFIKQQKQKPLGGESHPPTSPLILPFLLISSPSAPHSQIPTRRSMTFVSPISPHACPRADILFTVIIQLELSHQYDGLPNREYCSIYKSYQEIMLADQYTRQTPLSLKIIEYVNVAATITFLLLFIRRFHQLKGHSDTFKYKKYFPKMRLAFCLLFTAFSAGLLIHNITTDSYEAEAWYEYLLQGGGGQCINALILLLQLRVLRFQLNKEQPYSPYHFSYFIYLTVLEIARFVFTLIDTIDSQNDYVTLTLSSLILVVTLVQLFYWKIKRKSLPEFVAPTQLQIDDLNLHVHHIQIRSERLERSTFTKSNKKFPFLVPFVCYQNGKFKIVLERINHEKDNENRSTKTSDKEKKQTEIEDSLLTNSPFREEIVEKEVVAAVHYSYDQVKKLYAICGRFSIRKEHQINFQGASLSELVHAFHRLLTDILANENHYDRELLQFLEIPASAIKDYEILLEKSFILHAETQQKIDPIGGIVIPEDTNGTYFSIVGYKSLWIGNHLTFYFKVATRTRGYVSYPFKRIQDIQGFHHYLKRTLKHVGKHIDIPAFCKNREERQCTEEANSLHYIELHLRNICNEYCLMSYEPTAQIIQDFLGFPHLSNVDPIFESQFYRELKIQPKDYCLTLINKESTTIYQLNLLKNREHLKTLSKDTNSLVVFNQQVQRFIKNNHIMNKLQLALDKKDRKETTLHKISQYLQEVSQIRHISKLYCASAFFDAGNCQKVLGNFRNTAKMIEHANQERNSSLSQNSESHHGFKIMDSPPTFLSNRISNILDDLGNQSLDSP